MALTPRRFMSGDIESEARQGQQPLKELSLLVVLSMIPENKGELSSVGTHRHFGLEMSWAIRILGRLLRVVCAL